MSRVRDAVAAALAGSFLQWSLPRLSPLVLACVAAAQFTVTRTQDLTAWKGGGFGMFSTIDGPGARFVRAYVLFEDREVQLAVPQRFGSLVARTRALPTARNLELLAIRMADFARVTYMPSADRQMTYMGTPQSQPIVTDSTMVVIGTRIEVWKYTLDPGAPLLRSYRAHSRVHP